MFRPLLGHLQVLWENRSKNYQDKYNVSVNNKTLYFIYNKNNILSGRHVSTFIRSSSGPLGKDIQELSR